MSGYQRLNTELNSRLSVVTRVGRSKGSVTERWLYIPVPAFLCMQDVNRGEVAPWVVCGHREGHSKAWPAVRMQGRGLIATFLLRVQRSSEFITLYGDIFNRLRVFRIANTVRLGCEVGQERWLHMGPSENYVAR